MDKLSDLKYKRYSADILKKCDQKIDDITNDFRRRGVLQSGFYIQSVIEEYIKSIKKIAQLKLKFDKDSIQTVSDKTTAQLMKKQTFLLNSLENDFSSKINMLLSRYQMGKDLQNSSIHNLKKEITNIKNKIKTDVDIFILEKINSNPNNANKKEKIIKILNEYIDELDKISTQHTNSNFVNNHIENRLDRWHIRLKEIIKAELGNKESEKFEEIYFYDPIEDLTNMSNSFNQQINEFKTYLKDLIQEINLHPEHYFFSSIPKEKNIAKNDMTDNNNNIINDNFDFINNSKLKTIVQRDIKELNICIKNNLTKAIIIFSGSILETILLDILLKNESVAKKSKKADPKNTDLRTWNLSTLINVADDLNIINTGAYKFSNSLKNYRNLIHAGKELRDSMIIATEEANISISVLKIVIRSIKNNNISLKNTL